jgi:hypothetical protein
MKRCLTSDGFCDGENLASLRHSLLSSNTQSHSTNQVLNVFAEFASTFYVQLELVTKADAQTNPEAVTPELIVFFRIHL